MCGGCCSRIYQALPWRRLISLGGLTVRPLTHCAGIITLTGWVALAALVSLVIVVVGGIVLGYRRWAGLDKPVTVVTKQGDV